MDGGAIANTDDMIHDMMIVEFATVHCTNGCHFKFLQKKILPVSIP